jgi:hypothetical protein
MPAAPWGAAGVCRRHDMPSINPVETPGELPGACEIVLVGGSIVGVSTAPFLTRQGTPVLPCVKGILGGEQSSWGIGVGVKGSPVPGDGAVVGAVNGRALA